MKRYAVQLHARERNTILAALRFWQAHRSSKEARCDIVENDHESFDDIARDGGRGGELNQLEIDVLCEQINRDLSNWERNDYQFPRLLSEIAANIQLTPDQLDMLLESMDLTSEQVDYLFDRAQAVWEDIKELTELNPPRDRYEVSLPNTSGKPGMVQYGEFDTYEEALASAMKYFGADQTGNINIINKLAP